MMSHASNHNSLVSADLGYTILYMLSDLLMSKRLLIISISTSHLLFRRLSNGLSQSLCPPVKSIRDKKNYFLSH